MTWNVDAGLLVEQIVPVLCIYREAAGEGSDGMAAVGWVILNRMKRHRQTAEQVCLQKWQFSSMNAPGDPGMLHYPDTDADREAFRQAYIIWTGALNGTIADPTDGCTLYYANSIPPPNWTTRAQFVRQIGNQLFYRE